MISFLINVMLFFGLVLFLVFGAAAMIWVARARASRDHGCTCPWNWFWGFSRRHDCPVHGR